MLSVIELCLGGGHPGAEEYRHRVRRVLLLHGHLWLDSLLRWVSKRLFHQAHGHPLSFHSLLWLLFRRWCRLMATRRGESLGAGDPGLLINVLRLLVLCCVL